MFGAGATCFTTATAMARPVLAMRCWTDMRVELYTPQHKQAWDEFVAGSRNGTFLVHRDHMEYHRDRFCDSSLLVFDDRGRLVALLPANRDGRSEEHTSELQSLRH